MVPALTPEPSGDTSCSDTAAALLDASLERAAQQLGDITEPVMLRFYQAYPEAKAAFDRLSLGHRAKLEAEMISSTLYCLMNWLNRPNEIRIILADSVPHHQETLKIELDWYRGLISHAIDVIEETVPGDSPAELQIWSQIRSGLDTTVHAARSRYISHT